MITTLVYVGTLLFLSASLVRAWLAQQKLEVECNHKVMNQDAHIRDLQMKVSAANGKLGPLTQKINKLNEQLEELQGVNN